MKAKRRITTARDARPSVPSRAPRDRTLRERTRSVTPRRPEIAPSPPTTPTVVDVDLSVDLGRGLVLENPILVASGTIGYESIFACGLILFVLTLIMNMIAIRFVRKYREVYE